MVAGGQRLGNQGTMRLALVSLVAIAGLAGAAGAQTAAPTADPAPTPAPAAAAPEASTIPPAPVADTLAAPAAVAPVTPAPEPAAVQAPPAPPAPPTDPTAIALLNVLEQVCLPAANGGNLAQITKAAGFRKSGENFVLKQPTYQFTVLAPGYNPTQCHVDLAHPIDPEAPAKPLVIALHNWTVISRGWTLYRNDKNVAAGQEFTTRSWEHTADGKVEAVVITTMRKADGTPSLKNADTSTLLYSVTKTPG